MLTYALSGRDASAFTINPSTAQLRTAADLTLFSYLVTVTVDDDESGSDSIVVIITTYPARENSCEYTGQLHEGDWTFYTTSAPQAGSVSLTLTEDDLPTQVCGHNGDHYTTTSNVQLYCSVQVDPALYEWVEIRSCDFISTPTPPTTTPGDGDGDGGDGGDTDDGGDGGGGGTTTSAPGVPRNLDAVAGNGEVVLSWDAPESDGGEAITDYEYRINGQNPWISTGSTETTHTVTGLDNGAEYTFEVRAVNRVGKSFAPSQVEATPEAPEVFTLDFAHFANGDGTTSDLVFVNVGSVPVRPTLYFYDTEGKPIDPGSVVDVTGDLEVTEDGGLSIPAMEPLGELTIATHGQGVVVTGSVRVVAFGPIGGGLRYNLPAIGEAVVGASPPVSDALFAVRRQEGGITTGVAVHNLEAEAMEVVCELMQEGVLRDTVSLSLEANGQTAWLIDGAFPGTDTSDFVGSVRCDAPAMFSAVALEMDPGTRVFLTLPLFPVNRRAGGPAASLDFAHFANGDGTTSDLVFVNVSTQRSGPAPTPFHTDIPPIRPAIYFYDKEGHLIAAESVVDITGDLEITEDGALTVQTEMEPLGVLTISTHGRGQLVSGSARVVSDGPIGGMLRFDLPHIGEAGVGASPPVSDALFPVRRQEARNQHRGGAPQPGIESGVGALRIDARGRAARLREYPSGGQRAVVLVHRRRRSPGPIRPPSRGRCAAMRLGRACSPPWPWKWMPPPASSSTLPVVPVPERMSSGVDAPVSLSCLRNNGTAGALLGDGKPNRLAGMANDMRRAGSSAPLLTFCPGTFPAAYLGCGRTFLLAVFVLASLVFLSVDNALAQGTVATDRAALVALYNATGGADWTDNTHWLTNEALSEWHGVTTDANGRVTRLNLSANELSGEIPAALGNLANLSYLNLDVNELSGEIPAELGDLANLQELSLLGNGLSGEIPAELGDLTNLQLLYLSANELSGEIPAELGNLANLWQLYLWGNELSGEIPAELGDSDQPRGAVSLRE